MSDTPLTMVRGSMPCASLKRDLRRPAGGRSRRWPVSMAAVMLVGIHDDPAVDVPRRPPDGLDERRLAAQEAFLVGVEDGHQRDLGQVEPFAQQVDAHQHVELAQPQLADGAGCARGCRPRECR